MARLIDRLDDELPVRGLRRVQADEPRTERWERTAAPAASLDVRRRKKRAKITVVVDGVGRLDLDRAACNEPAAVLGALDSLLGAAWRVGHTTEPSVILTPLASDAYGDDTHSAEAWTQLVDSLDTQVREAAALRERAAVAETQLAALGEEAMRLRARADEVDHIAESLDKALHRESELARELDYQHLQVEVLSAALAERRHDPGLFSELGRSILRLFRRR